MKVDGLIFDHVSEVKDENSITENVFVGMCLIYIFIYVELLFSILAEEREELEVLNKYHQKQLELKHRQLLKELEILKSAQQTPIDSDYKNLM